MEGTSFILSWPKAGRDLRFQLQPERICCSQIGDLSHKKGSSKNFTGVHITDNLGTIPQIKGRSYTLTPTRVFYSQNGDLSHTKGTGSTYKAKKVVLQTLWGPIPTKKVVATL